MNHLRAPLRGRIPRKKVPSFPRSVKIIGRGYRVQAVKNWHYYDGLPRNHPHFVLLDRYQRPLGVIGFQVLPEGLMIDNIQREYPFVSNESRKKRVHRHWEPEPLEAQRKASRVHAVVASHALGRPPLEMLLNEFIRLQSRKILAGKRVYFRPRFLSQILFGSLTESEKFERRSTRVLVKRYFDVQPGYLQTYENGFKVDNFVYELDLSKNHTREALGLPPLEKEKKK